MFETALALAMPYLVPIAGGIITTGFAWIGKKLSGLIGTKTDNAKASRAMESLTHLVTNVVAEMETIKPSLGDMMQDGKLTDAGKEYLKRKAIGTVMMQLPDSTQQIARGVVNNLPEYIGTKVEAAVLAQKALRPLELITSFTSEN